MIPILMMSMQFAETQRRYQIAEAMSYGLPVITTKGAPWSVINEMGCGWWVDIGAKQLESALHEATETSTIDLFKMGSKGRKLVENEYSWPRVATQMVDLYRWVLGESNKPNFIF